MRIEGFIDGSYETASRIQAGEQCINLFVENIPQGGKTGKSLLSVPGVVEFATMPDAPGRGIFFENDRLWAVYGGKLCEIEADGTVFERGPVALDGNPVSFATNGEGGNQLLASSGDNAYSLDLVTDALTLEESDVTFVGQVDGFGVALDGTTSTLKISEALDFTTWDPLQITQRSSAADGWKAMIVSGAEIVLIGSKTGDVYFNAGSSPFPFQQRTEAFFETGIAAPFSLARFMGTVAWLGQDSLGSGQVYLLSGYTPEVISTPALEWTIQQYKDSDGIEDAIGWSYKREGHEFYVLTFPAVGKSWVYDGTTRKWHERGLWSSEANMFIAYRPQFHASGFGKNLVCDAQSNKIYAFSSTTYTDVGSRALKRQRRSPHTSDENRRLTFPYFELEADRGVGIAPADLDNPDDTVGYDPQVTLRYSDNGGHTWGPERGRSLGKQGEYDTRIRWDMCGAGRDRVWEVAVTDPVPVRIFDAYMGVGRRAA